MSCCTTTSTSAAASAQAATATPPPPANFSQASPVLQCQQTSGSLRSNTNSALRAANMVLESSHRPQPTGAPEPGSASAGSGAVIEGQANVGLESTENPSLMAVTRNGLEKHSRDKNNFLPRPAEADGRVRQQPHSHMPPPRADATNDAETNSGLKTQVERPTNSDNEFKQSEAEQEMRKEASSISLLSTDRTSGSDLDGHKAGRKINENFVTTLGDNYKFQDAQGAGAEGEKEKSFVELKRATGDGNRAIATNSDLSNKAERPAPRRKLSVFSFNGFPNIQLLDQDNIDRCRNLKIQEPSEMQRWITIAGLSATASINCSNNNDSAGSNDVQTTHQALISSGESKEEKGVSMSSFGGGKNRRSVRSDTLGSTGSSRASSCDEPTIAGTTKTGTATTVGRISSNSSSASSQSSQSSSSSSLMVNQPERKRSIEAMHQSVSNSSLDSMMNWQQGSATGEETSNKQTENSTTLLAADTKLFQQPFESIKVQLKKKNSIPNAQNIQRHIDNLISQNEAIIDNCNLISIRSYNSSKVDSQHQQPVGPLISTTGKAAQTQSKPAASRDGPTTSLGTIKLKPQTTTWSPLMAPGLLTTPSFGSQAPDAIGNSGSLKHLTATGGRLRQPERKRSYNLSQQAREDQFTLQQYPMASALISPKPLGYLEEPLLVSRPQLVLEGSAEPHLSHRSRDPHHLESAIQNLSLKKGENQLPQSSQPVEATSSLCNNHFLINREQAPLASHITTPLKIDTSTAASGIGIVGSGGHANSSSGAGGGVEAAFTAAMDLRQQQLQIHQQANLILKLNHERDLMAKLLLEQTQQQRHYQPSFEDQRVVAAAALLHQQHMIEQNQLDQQLSRYSQQQHSAFSDGRANLQYSANAGLLVPMQPQMAQPLTLASNYLREHQALENQQLKDLLTRMMAPTALINQQQRHLFTTSATTSSTTLPHDSLPFKKRKISEPNMRY